MTLLLCLVIACQAFVLYRTQRDLSRAIAALEEAARLGEEMNTALTHALTHLSIASNLVAQMQTRKPWTEDEIRASIQH